MQDREAEPRFAGPPSREFNATKGSTFSGNFSGGGGGGGGGGSGGRQIYVSNVCNPLAPLFPLSSPSPPKRSFLKFDTWHYSYRSMLAGKT